MTEIRSMSIVALGGNLPFGSGGPQQTLIAAIEALAGMGLQLGSISRFFKTPCFPAGAGPDYVNAVIGIRADLPAEQLLMRLHAIEDRFARVREQRWGMRTLDLDLIAVGDQVLPDYECFSKWLQLPQQAQMQQAPDQLILPHPRLQDRGFVLVPLCDIAPHWRHPVLHKTAAELLAALPDETIAEVVPL